MQEIRNPLNPPPAQCLPGRCPHRRRSRGSAPSSAARLPQDTFGRAMLCFTGRCRAARGRLKRVANKLKIHVQLPAGFLPRTLGCCSPCPREKPRLREAQESVGKGTPVLGPRDVPADDELPCCLQELWAIFGPFRAGWHGAQPVFGPLCLKWPCWNCTGDLDIGVNATHGKSRLEQRGLFGFGGFFIVVVLGGGFLFFFPLLEGCLSHTPYVPSSILPLQWCRLGSGDAIGCGAVQGPSSHPPAAGHREGIGCGSGWGGGCLSRCSVSSRCFQPER